MNKKSLLNQIIIELETVLDNAKEAVVRAHNTATDKENISQNRYDTLALEGAYLARGQSARMVECEADLCLYKNISMIEFSDEMPIAIGALVYLDNNKKGQKILFVGPSAGGLKLNHLKDEIIIITPTSPLGNMLLGKMVDDEFELITGNQKNRYTIMNVY